MSQVAGIKLENIPTTRGLRRAVRRVLSGSYLNPKMTHVFCSLISQPPVVHVRRDTVLCLDFVLSVYMFLLRTESLNAWLFLEVAVPAGTFIKKGTPGLW